jgi:hypothetical protein
VFNDQWEIVALHHSGVPKKDAQGRILARDGQVYTSSMGENQIDWIANEGVRISQILMHLQGLSLSAGQGTLRKQLLDSEKGWQAGTTASAPAEMTVGGYPTGDMELMAPVMEALPPARAASVGQDSAAEWLVSGNNGAASSWP